jgi:hypothetical protein
MGAAGRPGPRTYEDQDMSEAYRCQTAGERLRAMVDDVRNGVAIYAELRLTVDSLTRTKPVWVLAETGDHRLDGTVLAVANGIDHAEQVRANLAVLNARREAMGLPEIRLRDRR